ncbi:D-alanyl-D-alanine carboxypeptidase/D-alanyl-D-alanine-endopeptidase [Azospira restricta]|uniref:D-alanyl-D-alanine carboxypeptidase/D-alanyl-D-alanine endopeptidase n=1 Tax=Azospira restricta TaxID=404405 RepID=UPI00193C50CC|nr:D-alanyl-D-alanine carboxypeptidase/D-alanyl-D-alanine-endopeptidase [Azospira restricta]
MSFSLPRALAALTLLLAAAGAAAALPAPVRDALREGGVPPAHAAFFVQRVDAGKPLLAHNAERPMNPASVMKLVTAYAALDLLGPAYTWKTEALADAPPADGRLAGNLYLRGSGDPGLDLERFTQLLRQLKNRGVAEIDGDLVLDRGAFRLPPHDPAAFDNQPLRAYNAGPDALLIDHKSLRVTLVPDTAARRVEVFAENPAAGVRLDGRVAFDEAPCNSWRERLQVGVDGATLSLAGSYSGRCGEKTLHLAPWPADRQVEQLFRALWRELGGRFAGRVRDGETPAGARLLYAHESPPLAEQLRGMNKWSNNVTARQVFLTLAAERPATPDAARQAIGRWLATKGVAGSVLDNGSGLSQAERLSAAGLGRLLLDAWDSPVMPELLASLPIAGSDGTLKKRLQDGPAAGRAHLKTGYLDGVRSIAGYVLDTSGRRWVVVGFINDAQLKNGAAPLDALVRWVAER